jgi:amino acid transporter
LSIIRQDAFKQLEAEPRDGVQPKLGHLGIASFVLSAAAPLTVVAGLITTGFATIGVVGLPLAFFVIGAVLAVFCVGFNAMSRRISNAGAFYAYAAQGLGRPIGVGSGLIAALAYNLLQVGLYGMFGAAVSPLLNPAVEAVFDVTPHWAVWALLAWAIVSILGFQRVDLNSLVLLVLMGAEVLVVVIFGGGNLANPADGTLSLAGFDPSNLFTAGFGAAVVLAITGFVGFEGSAIYSEDARDAKRTVPQATYLCLIVIAVLYGLYSWSLTVTTGPDNVAAVTGENPSEVVFTLAAANIAPAWIAIGHALFATSLLAALISYHNAVNRYMFALGREGVLPRIFGVTTRANTPKWGSVFQSGFGLIVIMVYAIAGLDPVVQLFFWVGTTGGFGVLCLLAVTSVAVIGYHLRHRSENVWRGVVAPTAAGLMILCLLYGAIDNFDTLLGVAPSSPLRWVLPSLFLIAGALGVGWGLVLRRIRPRTYRNIGLGANSSTGRSTSLQAILASTADETRTVQ